MKRTLVIGLILVLMLIGMGCIFFPKKVEGYTTNVDGITWYYSLSNGEAVNVYVASYTGTLSTTLKIPETLDGYVVRSIGRNYNSYNILNSTYQNLVVEKVIIPETVTTIGRNSFYNFRNLKTVVTSADSTEKFQLPSGLKTIEYYAFQYCFALTEVNLPDSVESIGTYAFYNCSAIKNVKFGDKIKTIPNYMFYGCGALSKVELPAALEGVGDSAFYSCRSLTDITLPDNVRSIGREAFKYCNSLKEVKTTNNANEGVISFPSELRTLGINAFYGCGKLSGKIKFPQNLSEIPQGTFRGCGMNGILDIPSTVLVVGNSAFYGCSNITEVRLADGVQKVNSSAFYGCSKIDKIIFPESILRVDNQSFANTAIRDAWVEKIKGTVTFEEYWAGGSSYENVMRPFIHYQECKHDISFSLPEGVHFVNTTTGQIAQNFSANCGENYEYRVSVDEEYNYRNLVMLTKTQGAFQESPIEEVTTNVQNGSIVRIDNILRAKEFYVQNINVDTDLVLRTFIEEINRQALAQSREPNVELINGVCQYKHSKYPINVKSEDLITYRIRVYNEGLKEGAAQKITEYLPEGLVLETNNMVNQQYGWVDLGNGKIETTYLKDKLINKYTGAGSLDYKDVLLVCKVTAQEPETDNLRLVNIAEITEGSSIEADDDFGSITQSVSVDYKKDQSILSNETIYVHGTQEDDDFENVVIMRKTPISYNLKLTEVDQDTSNLLEGAKFDLLNANKEVIKSGITKVDGTIDFGLITSNGAGKDVYYVVESRSPVGYRAIQKGEIKLEVLKTVTDKDTESYKIEVICDLLDTEIDTSMYNYIPVSTREQLSKIGSGEKIIINDVEYEFTNGKNYKLTQDIDLAGEEWTPIVAEGCVVDGDGFKIKNLTMTAGEKLARTETGLFRTFSGIIKNVTLENVNIDINEIYAIDEEGVDTLTGKVGVGALVGYMASGTISNCSVAGAIKVNSDNVGGFVGYAKEERLLMISDSANNADITVTGSNVGGLVGCSYSALDIKKSTNNGNITATGRNVAGLAGFVEATDYQIENVNASYEAESNVINLVVENKRTYGMYTIKLETVDVNSLQLIPGSTFVVLDENLEIMYENVKLVNGQLEVAQINIEEVGTDIYYIRQVSAPAGYKKIDNFIKLTVKRYWDGENLDAFKVSIDIDFISMEDIKNDEVVEDPVIVKPVQKYEAAIYSNIDWRASKIRIVDSTNNGEIVSDDVAVAGGVGYSNCSVELVNCKNTGNITAKGNAAGIIAEVKKQDEKTIFDAIACENNGKIALKPQEEKGVYAVAGIAALVQVDSSIDKCSNSGEIVIPDSKESKITNEYNVAAGIVADAGRLLSVSECTNTGKVSTVVKGAITAGIVGRNIPLDTPCTTEVSGCINKADICGGSHTAGIVAYTSSVSVSVRGCKVEDSNIMSRDGDISAMLASANTEKIKIKDCLMNNTKLEFKSDSGYACSGKTASMLGMVCKYGFRSGINVESIDIEDCNVQDSDIKATSNDAAGIMGMGYGTSAVTKINIVNCKVDKTNISNYDTNGCYSAVGGILANFYDLGNVSIRECTVTNGEFSVKAKETGYSNDANIGGILGSVVYPKNVSVLNCKVDNLKIDSLTNNDGCANTGGIVGYVGFSSINSFNVKHCSAENIDIYVKNGNMGGILGAHMYVENTVEIEECSVKNANLESLGSGSNSNAGGLVGYGFKNIKLDKCRIEDSNIKSSGHNLAGIIGMSYERAYISNCDVIRTDLNHDCKDAQQYDCKGGIVGYVMQYAEIENCNVIDVKMIGNSGNSGGIAGYLAGYESKDDTIVNCNVINVDMSTTMTSDYAASNATLGGIAGGIGGKTIFEGCNVDNCDIIGNVTCMGGLLGTGQSADFNHCVVDNVKVSDNSEASSYDTRARGGAVGALTYILRMSDVKVKNSSIVGNAYSIGGIVGFVVTAERLEDCTLENSTITGGSEKNTKSNGSIGGIVGDISSLNDDVKNCAVINSTLTTSSDNIGGIVGTIASNNSKVITNCRVSGSELKQTNGVAVQESYNRAVGGILGVVTYGGEVVNSVVENTNISADYGVNGTILTGGIAGYNWNSVIQGATVSDVTITNNSTIGLAGGIIANTQNGGAVKNSNVIDSKIQNMAGAIGGIAGYADNQLIDSKVSNTEITSTSEYSYGLGGIVGIGNNVYDDSKTMTYVKGCTVENCKLTGTNAVGGIAGACVPDIIDCIVKGINNVIEETMELPTATINKSQATNAKATAEEPIVENKENEVMIEKDKTIDDNQKVLENETVQSNITELNSDNQEESGKAPVTEVKTEDGEKTSVSEKISLKAISETDESIIDGRNIVESEALVEKEETAPQDEIEDATTMTEEPVIEEAKIEQGEVKEQENEIEETKTPVTEETEKEIPENVEDSVLDNDVTKLELNTEKAEQPRETVTNKDENSPATIVLGLIKKISRTEYGTNIVGKRFVGAIIGDAGVIEDSSLQKVLLIVNCSVNSTMVKGVEFFDNFVGRANQGVESHNAVGATWDAETSIKELIVEENV